MSEMRLYNTDGNRLYLTTQERAAFLDTARLARPEVRSFAETLAYTGCRISEALELVPKRVQLDAGRVVFRSLKKRREDVYRAVPVPPEYLDTLNIVHRIRDAQKSKKRGNEKLWTWTRQHASSEIIKGLMIAAGIPDGAHRTAKGLRFMASWSGISSPLYGLGATECGLSRLRALNGRMLPGCANGFAGRGVGTYDRKGDVEKAGGLLVPIDCKNLF